MLTQRIGKSANEFLTMEGVSPEAVFLLGKDLNSFKEIAQGLLDGSPELRLAGSKDAQTRERLDALLKLYEQTRTQAGAILGNLQGLVSAREAQASIIADSEPLRRSLEDLQGKLSAQTGLGAGAAARSLASRRCFAILLRHRPGLSCSCRTAASARSVAESSARKPNARSRKPSASTTPTRRPFCG